VFFVAVANHEIDSRIFLRKISVSGPFAATISAAFRSLQDLSTLAITESRLHFKRADLKVFNDRQEFGRMSFRQA
jgi:hypothetical protein